MASRSLRHSSVRKPAARTSGLRYVDLSDGHGGWRREKAGAGFRYRDAKGRLLTRPTDLERIRRLAIPPAWTHVWICPFPSGHVQATGRDARGRKQYRYHPAWRAARDSDKFERVVAHGRALPKIRRQVARDLRRPPLSRLAVLATVVRLLESTLIRVGNEEYARANHSYGLTTLRPRHVTIRRDALKFHFRGKSGKLHTVELHDRRLAARLRRLSDLPGQELFHYLDENGEVHPVTSTDVNDYLHAIAGEQFSAKDFRTWAGTLAAACVLNHTKPHQGRYLTKKQIAEAVEQVAEQLGNTPAICRKSYIHPAVIDGCRMGAGSIPLTAAIVQQPSRSTSLSRDEKALLAFLRAPPSSLQNLARAAG